MLIALTVFCLAIAVGGTVFYGLVTLAAGQFQKRPLPTLAKPPAVSVLKPLSGLDLGLEENLQSFADLDYPDFEILFAVRTEDDPAAAVARRLIAERPETPARLLVAGEPPSLAAYPNAKNWSLQRMAEEAGGEILVISDSDIRASKDDLRRIAAEFTDPTVGVVTCPYAAKSGPSLWSRLEAIGMNTEFWGGVLAAQMLAPMDFAVGPTMAIRRQCLDELGGFEATRDYLAEDFVLGAWARRRGWNVRLARTVVEHHIGAQRLGPNLLHRIRWNRSTRRSRPAGYVGQIFTYPLPFAFLLAALAPSVWWPWTLLAGCLAARLTAARAVSGALGARLRPADWALLPLQDLLSFCIWILAFFGRTIVWRGRRFLLTGDGRLRPETAG